MNVIAKRGFTLIELLVVISIIALLSSIILPTLNDARERTKRVKFVQELKQVQTALEVYKSDNGHYPYENWGDQVDEYANFIIVYDTGLGSYTQSDYLTEFLNSNAGVNSNYTDSVNFIPNYIKSLPVLSLTKTKPGDGEARFFYENQSFIDSIAQYNQNGMTCGGKPMNGYVLRYDIGITDPVDIDMNLPALLDSSGNSIGSLCLTGN